MEDGGGQGQGQGQAQAQGNHHHRQPPCPSPCRLHPGTAVGFFTFPEFHTLLELANMGGVVSEGLALAVYNAWHDRAEVLLENEYKSTKETIELNLHASCIQRVFRSKKEREAKLAAKAKLERAGSQAGIEFAKNIALESFRYP